MTRSMDETSAHSLETLFQAGIIGSYPDRELLRLIREGSRETADDAFAAIVGRHGPMVHRACTNSLRNSHDADDAFQATFLILARKAERLWVDHSLAPWLHGVAVRVCSNIRANQRRRRFHENQASEQTRPINENAELQPLNEILHEEIERLPARYRVPIVLCCLEGVSTEAAGQTLGCPRGTILSRLSRGRERLRDRLARRGFASPGVLVTALSPPRARLFEAGKPLFHVAMQTATLLSQNRAGSTITARVLSLSQDVSRSLTMTKLKTAAALALVTASTTGLGVLSQGAFSDDSKAPPVQVATVAETPRATPTQPKKNSADATEALASARSKLAEIRHTLNSSGLDLAPSLRERFDQIESDLQKIQGALSNSKPSTLDTEQAVPGHEKQKAQTNSSLNKESAERPPISEQSLAASRTRSEGGSELQAILSIGKYLFTASPMGNRAIAYDPITHESKSVQLNASAENPLKVVPMPRYGNFVPIRIEGSRITRLAVFDFNTDQWQAIDLAEPAMGSIQPEFIGKDGVAYHIRSHTYVFTIKNGLWDHLDTSKIAEELPQ